MSDAPKPKEPTSAGAAASAPADGVAPDAKPVEEKTQPYRLKPLVEKLARQRRRTTAAELVVKRPRQPEVRVPLDRTEMIIGRDSGCDIVLNEESASRRHAKIQRNAGGYFEIVDLDSRNGVIVDDDKVKRMTLLDGDAFIIGDTQFMIVVGPIVGSE